MSVIYTYLSDLKAYLKKKKPSSVFLITSDVLAEKLHWALEEISEILSIPLTIITIADGEKAKEWNGLEKLLGALARHGADRKSILIALGGGSVGDLVGFAASIYQRGIPYIQIPTTLLAQVDSAFGGKTGINFLGYKNQIGSFNEAEIIIVDPRFTWSLSEEQFVDGLGEIIKAGFIHDVSILRLLEKEKINTLLKSKNLTLLIQKAIKVKLYYVKEDFKDKGKRQILNVGHTLGHSIEVKHSIGHGRAVLIGTYQELGVTEKLGLTKNGTQEKFKKTIEGLGIKINFKLKADWNKILHDKKISSDTMVLPVVISPGKSKLVILPIKELKKHV